MAKLYLIAGEASGDLHGSNLIKAILRLAPDTNIRCWGGDLMAAQGGQLVKHFRDLAFMGFAEVVMNLPTILGNIAFCKKDITAFAPDVLVLIDYPGFNLRIAEWASKKGIKVVYYVAPQVWAWKPGRVHLMKASIHALLCILPFEKAWFKKNAGWEVQYVGHPLLDAIANFKPELPAVSTRPVVAILPGSRKQEIQTKLPVMLKVAAHFPAYHFVVAMAPGLSEAFFAPFLKPYPNTSAVQGKTYEILAQARAALVTSGTATLETALFKVPEVVCYKGNPISYEIAKRLVKVPFISLVNLIMEKQVVTELIQDEMNEKKLTDELGKILEEGTARKQMLADYDALAQALHTGNSPSAVAAAIILKAIPA